MGDSATYEFGFHTRAEALLNKELFSDVEIQVIDGNNHKTFHAHKLFLAMGSKEFAKLFYENSESPKICKIFDFKPQTVFLMLQYLYTNKLELNVIEARELYSLAKKFGIRNLQELCVDFISGNEINEDNVLHMYECAVKEKYINLLSKCRTIVSVHTKTVFESPYFVEVSLAVIEDILKLGSLNVESELEIIEAVIRWACYECRRRRISDDCHNLRECLYPLLRHMRFFTLKVEEFSSIVEKYNILNAHESSIITRKLLQPESFVSLPCYLCTEIRPRKNLSCEPSSLNSESLTKISKESASNIALQETRTKLQYNSTLSYYKTNSSSSSFNKNKIRKPSPVSKVFPQVQKSSPEGLSVKKTSSNLPSQVQIYDLPLQEIEKLFSTAFNNDVKCSMVINLLKGDLLIHGLELRINQKSNNKEFMQVLLNVSYSGNQVTNSDSFNEELKGGILSLTFNQPIKVSETNPVTIEVTIEELTLNRCCIIKNPICELNYKSEIIADIALTCNQMNESGDYFFLINRLKFSSI